YEPGINRTYQELAEHYATAILPTRPRKPRDKAKVEVAVQIVQRFVLARLRNRRFFSLHELNTAIRECVADLNAKIMRKLGVSRNELFAEIDRPALKALPSAPYQYAEWKKCRAAPDYHVEIANHYYSVPARLIREELPLDQVDPAAWARSRLCERRAAASATHPSPQHPRQWLLPLRKGETMLTHPTLSRLVTLGLTGMASAFDEQQRQPDITALAFEERFALLVDREATERANKRLVNRLRFASLRQNAVVEDIDTKAPRGLEKALFQKLIAGEWIERHQNLLISG